MAMNYQETINYLFNATPVFEHIGAPAYKNGLENSIALDIRYGHPHKKFKSIHVAGTNGKGSCSHTLASILQEAGYKVGLYTSPHLIDFRERIKINGKCINSEYVVDFVEKERNFFEPLHPSFFELTTALAFKYFADNNIDYAVIEVGLGGRLDCTNIITPLMSIITNISYDHTQFLGNTLEKIATEKAGIIKANIPVIIGETTNETKNVFSEKARSVNAPIIFAEDNSEISNYILTSRGGITYNTKHYGQINGDLGGIYQIKNTNTILNAVKILKNHGIIKNNSEIEKGISNVCRNTGLSGRWQLLGTSPTIICDTGHNLGGWMYLNKQIRTQQYSSLRIVFGMVDDKDIDSIMMLMPKDAVYYFTKAETKRAIPEKTVKDKGLSHGLKGNCFSNVKDAYEKAMNDATDNDFIFIGGSSYIVADLLSYLRSKSII